MSSHANRGERNLTEERNIKAEENWDKAKAVLGRYVGGCLFIVLLIAFAIIFMAGYVTGLPQVCLTGKPTHASTP